MHTTLLRTSIIAVLATFVATVVSDAQPTTFPTFTEQVKPKRRELHLWGIRAYPFGRIPQNARQSALDHVATKMRSFGESSLQSIARWEPIGPFNIGGRVRSIAVHPTDGRTVWIGAADGGVWKTTDQGATWNPMMDFENAIAMGAIAVDPNNPDILYAATGEMSSNIDAYTGAGVFKSTDGGSTWRGSGLTTVGAFSRIVVHPRNSSLVLAGATKNNGGLYRSDDGGATWSRTYPDMVSDITVNPGNENEIWIGTMTKGIWRSSDAGRTFARSSVGLGIDTLGRISVQVAASNPAILYALVNETSGTAAASRIYKTTNGGASWTIVFNNSPNFLNSPNAQGWYNHAIGVDPRNPDIVIGLGISLVRSSNGGESWQSQNTYGGFPVHPDQHAIAFDPSNAGVLYLGNDGGMYRSVDNGLSYSEISRGLAITQFYGFGVDQNQPNLTMGGSQDNGTMTNASQTISGGDGGECFYDPNNSSVLYTSSQNGALYRFDGGSGTALRQGLDPTEQDAIWMTPWTIDTRNTQVLFCVLRTVYASYNRGDEWIPTTKTFTGLGSAIAISTVDNNVIWAGSDRGEIAVSTDAGATWLDRTDAPGSPRRGVTDYAPSLTDAGTVYMTVSGFFTEHVFKSTDYGATWATIGRGLPDIPFNAIAIHPEDQNILYVGSDIGMFISIDGGSSWASYSNGLPRAAVVDLEVHATQRKLRAATHGRSMWEIPLERPTFDPSITSPAGGEVWMGGTRQTISWIGFSNPINLDISLDGGASWLSLGKNLVGPAYSWIVADTLAAYAIVRATDASEPTRNATSRTFTITRYTLGGVLATSTVRGIPYGICFDGQYLWATDFGSKTLLRIDPTTLAPNGSIELQLTGGDSLFTDLAFVKSRDHFFIHKLMNTTAANPGGYLYEVDRDGRQVARWRSPAAYPIGLVSLEEFDPASPYLFATDRNGNQAAYFFDFESLDPGSSVATPFATIPRTNRVELGPRGATHAPQAGKIYQVITDFTGSALQSAVGQKLDAQSLNEEACELSLTSPGDGRYYNARGIELDPRDSNLWVSDYSGNIYKIASCDGTPPKVILEPPAGIGDRSNGIITGTRLHQNVPNPAASNVEITFELPGATHARLALYAADGTLIAVLGEGRFAGGVSSIHASISHLPSGTYRYALEFPDRGVGLSRTMVIVR